MISAPNLLHEIGATGIITGGTGGFEPQQMKYLVNTLSAGSLPATLADEPVSERTVSPQLGVDNLYRGLLASLIGLVVVSIFLVGYYHIAGVVAFFAVIMNLIIILGVLAMFGATFTMPSIAGIVLTVGTAIDANVLVFERMREEEHRGHPLKMALQHAYDRALSAIVDSNMTTAITSLCLWVFGSEEVKGFGLTLLIGIVSSLFTALFVTKTIFAILIDKYGIKELGSVPTKYPKWDKLLHPNIDWMGMIWPFITFSTIFIIAGLSAFIVKKRDMFDVEFASGTTVQIELKEDSGLPLQKVRDLINQKSQQIPAASVVSINNSDKNYEIVTPSDKASVVRDAVLDVMGPYLKIERPSKFDQTGVKVEDALNKSIIPIDKDTLEIDGKPISEAASYVGGVAVVLRNLDPPISPNEVHSRIDRAATAPGSETNLGKWRVEVVGLNNDTSKDKNNNPSKDVVVLAMNPDFPYAKSAEGWKENTAVPMWRLINEGVNREAKLQKVSNFDPQVASGTRWQAFFATAFSIVAIMVYIWFRFGDLKYATATVVALVHDTLAVIGAVGLSHYLDNGFGHLFLVEPFRINLTLVAAILTIMGYSMIDTIVVFDRIRENRGRYGKISRKVINDSINQTLSRTLLTAGTTLVMVAVMYFCGGSGIHGFTFVLLVGILIGTYSSVAIAAPILLIGSDEESKRPEAVIERKSPIGQAQRAGADLTAVKRT
jgi:SecD/SecF fusion protein